MCGEVKYHKSVTMELGKKFSSFSEIKKYIEEYQQQNSVQLYISNSTKLDKVTTVNAKTANPDLVYYNIQYKCVHGGNFVSSSSGKRKSR